MLLYHSDNDNSTLYTIVFLFLLSIMWGPARLRRGQWSLFLLLHRSAHLVGEVVG